MPSAFKILLILLSGLLLSCEQEGNLSRQLDICSVEEQNRFVHEVLLDRYFWYQEVPSSIDYGAFFSPEQALSALRFDSLDRFSNITNAVAFNNLLNAGQFIGYGFSVHIENDDSAWVRFVYNDSPAGRAGMQRGHQIEAINGRPVEQIIRDNAFNTIFGPPELDYPLTISLRDEQGNDLDLDLQKAVVNINTVLHHSVVSNGSEDVGYLVFNSFLSTSNAELEQVFSEFSSANIRKLVLDLRYNGGGSVFVASNLASYLYRNHLQDDIFTTLIHNDKHQPRNSNFRFNTQANALDLEQVIVIATESTCSASELVINGLQPFIDVRVVGNTTCGKPVGFNGFQFCDKLLLPVTFSSFNQNNEGDYFAGLAPACSVNDNIEEDFGAQSEPMLAQALHLSNTNTCLTSAPRQLRPKSKQPYPANSLRAISGAY